MDSSILDNPLKKCSSCQKDVVCKFEKFHKSPSKGDTTKKRRKFTDETGRLWHGTRCPDCAAEWRKEQANEAATKKQAELKKLIES